jgi:hypothetical protein
MNVSDGLSIILSWDEYLDIPNYGSTAIVS